MKEQLDKIDALEEAAGKRPADQEVGDKTADAVKAEPVQTKAPGTDEKRPADQSGEQDEVGTDPKDAKTKATKVAAPVDVTEEEDEEEMGVKGKAKADAKEKIEESSTFSLSDELGSLLEGEEFTPEFQEKAVLVFEAAVNHASKQHLAKLDEAFDTALAEAVATIETALELKVEKYIDYASQEWLEENKLAVTTGIRTEIAESFMDQLKALLESHYVELPEGKADMYESSIKAQAELEDQLNEQIEKNIAAVEALAEAKKELAIQAFTKDMTDTQAEKVISMAEGVEFTTAEEFTSKLASLKENYFPKGKRASGLVTEDADGSPAEIVVESKTYDPEMEGYVKALALK